MKTFRKISDEETERINCLQADFFSKTKHYFDPPYPEGVPERLEMIVAAAEITRTCTVVDIGTGTGVLLPLIQQYAPAQTYANDICESMLESVRTRYPDVKTLLGGIRKLSMPDRSVDVFFVNACYPNLVDKHNTFANIRRMIRTNGRVIISHPMGRAFTSFLKKRMPFPVDDFPASEEEARELFAPYGFRIGKFIDEAELYILCLQFNEPVHGRVSAT